MGLENDINVLGRVELFRALSGDQLRLLAFGAETVRLLAGRDIYRENTMADCAFVVVSGEVALFREEGSRREVLASVSEGALLGELALISQGRRLTGASAATDCELLRLSRKLFRRMLEEYPDTAVRLHSRISENLSDMLDRIGKLDGAFKER